MRKDRKHRCGWCGHAFDSLDEITKHAIDADPTFACGAAETFRKRLRACGDRLEIASRILKGDGSFLYTGEEPLAAALGIMRDTAHVVQEIYDARERNLRGDS